MTFNDIITSTLRQKLENAGYETLEELKKANLIKLSKDLQLTREEAEIVISVTNKGIRHQKQSMAERIAEAEEYGITLSSKNLDQLLDKGVPMYRITEICGESGSGKTQICMQLAVNVQLSTVEGGVEGECIYIDTEGSFLPSRLIEIAKERNIGSISKGIHVFRILDYIELIAFVRQLPIILKEYPKVKLIVVDSMAYHFRLNTFDMKKRTCFVNNLAQELSQIASKNKLAIVATNHVTLSSTDGKWVPSLSPSWGNWCTNRMYLYRKRQFRFAFVFKSIESNKNTPEQFCIKTTGITDPDEDEAYLIAANVKKEAEVRNEIESTLEELRFSAEVKEYEEKILNNDWKEPEIQEDVVKDESKIEENFFELGNDPAANQNESIEQISTIEDNYDLGVENSNVLQKKSVVVTEPNVQERKNKSTAELTIQEKTQDEAEQNSNESDQHGKKRSREEEEIESGYWSSGIEDDLNFLINMDDMF